MSTAIDEIFDSILSVDVSFRNGDKVNVDFVMTYLASLPALGPMCPNLGKFRRVHGCLFLFLVSQLPVHESQILGRQVLVATAGSAESAPAFAMASG